MSHVYRWHPQLTASADGPMVGKSLLHLQQSDLDSACGPYCALMALMLMRLIKRHDLEKVSQTKKEPLATFWQRATPLYFIGSRPHQLATIFKAYQEQLTCYAVKKHLTHEVIQTLHADGLCIGAIRNGDFNHWVLVVGIGRKEGLLDGHKLLILDPALSALPMLPWNATLTLTANRRGLYRYETAIGDSKVFFDSALLIQPIIGDLEIDSV